MKVAILGAPGSGKTKIARRICRRLNTDSDWKVIDGYVDKLRERTGRPFGAASTLIDNLMVLSERRVLEDEALQKGHNTITCGSIYETLIYSAAQAMLIPSLADERLILEATRVAQTTMQALGIIEYQNFDYDALFYLPQAEPDEHSWTGVVDAKLGEVLEGFFRAAVRLDGTDRQKVDNAEEIIRTIASALTQTSEQQGV